jgi:hypothetical protein
LLANNKLQSSCSEISWHATASFHLLFLGWSCHHHQLCYKSLYVQHASCCKMFMCVHCVYLFSCHPRFDTGGSNACTYTHTILELFLLHFLCTLVNKCHWLPNFSQQTAEKLIRKHKHQTCIHTKECLPHYSYYSPCLTVYGTNVCNWTMLMTLDNIRHCLKPFNFQETNLLTYIHWDWWLEWKA